MALPVLTIAIPTFNRSRQILRNVTYLIPQLTDKVKLIVFDNASDNPVEVILRDILLSTGIAINRNKVNVGSVGNIIKCIESCDTDWLWILGDDDYPFGNGVEIALEHINKWPDASYINFKSIMAPNRSHDFICEGANEIIEKLDSFGNLLCLSLGLYNVKKLYPGLRFAYQYGYSLAPQTAFLLTGLREGQAVFSNTELIDFAANETATGEFWSWVSLSTVIGTLAELPLNLSEQSLRIFTGHLLTHIQRPKALYHILLNDKHYQPKEKVRFFKMIYDRSTFGRLLCERTMSFCNFYVKLWLKSLQKISNVDEAEKTRHYKRIERI